jgi:hypothetical protein
MEDALLAPSDAGKVQKGDELREETDADKALG